MSMCIYWNLKNKVTRDLIIPPWLNLKKGIVIDGLVTFYIQCKYMYVH